jgi:hypothetical protein
MAPLILMYREIILGAMKLDNGHGPCHAEFIENQGSRVTFKKIQREISTCKLTSEIPESWIRKLSNAQFLFLILHSGGTDGKNLHCLCQDSPADTSEFRVLNSPLLLYPVLVPLNILKSRLCSLLSSSNIVNRP